MVSVEDRVRYGAQLLDEVGPADWRSRIKVDSLYMASWSHCILGQLYGTFRTGVRTLMLDEAHAVSHGFHLFSETWEEDPTTFADLAAAWRTELATVPA